MRTMKKILLIVLPLFALVLGSYVPVDAFGGGGHSSGGHVGGGHFGGGHFGGGHFGGGHFGGGHFGGGHFGGGHFRGGHFHGHGHSGVDFVIGPWLWWPFPYYYPYPATSYPYPATSVVVPGESDIYVEPQYTEQNYWYYCSDPRGYFPYVKRCSTGWTTVTPTPTQ